jgi:hypothetical protein
MCVCERGMSEDSGQEKGLGTEKVPCKKMFLIAKTEVTFRIAKTEMHGKMYGQHVESQTKQQSENREATYVSGHVAT